MYQKMKTFVIKQIVWPTAMTDALQRTPNTHQIPEKNVVYSWNATGDRGIPTREWRVMEDGTLSKIHDIRALSATVHTNQGKWYWTPVNSVFGSYRSWDPFEIEVEYEE